LTLQSFSQTHLPSKVVVVNDNSTDKTAEIVLAFAKDNPFISLVERLQVQSIYLVVKLFSFSKGFETLDDTYDIIVKLDADLILPNNYFETIVKHFERKSTGMAGGFAYIEKNGEWILENLTDKDHIRGALKQKPVLNKWQSRNGWDTVDELLSTFYGWKVVTDDTLIKFT
jgi:cellulose synthase/poly-beta-1,6-N-acetylglucosamine synthase-like glycosyltransferase